MFSRFALLLLSMAGMLLASTVPSQAAVIEVTTTTDQAGMAAGCSLRQAVRAADLDFNQGDCPAGLGADTIKLPGGTYELTIPGTGETLNQTGDLNVQGIGALVIMPASDSPVVIDGGGIDRVFFHGGAGQLSLTDLTIRGGRLDPVADGGGILNGGGLLDLDGVTVTGNAALAGSGGGIYNETSISMVNSTISGNSSSQGGGGYFGTAFSLATFRNVTVFGNTADADGNNTGNGGGISASGTVNSFNSVIAGNIDNSPAVINQVPDCSTGPNFYPRYTMIGVPSPAHCLKGFDPGTNLTGDPRLGLLGDHGGPTPTHVPLAGSPLIDGAGNVAPDLCPTGDQRDVSRPQSGGCDIGAVELDPAGVDKPADPGVGEASLSLKKLGGKRVRARAGQVVKFRVRIRNVGDTASTHTRICLVTKGKSKKALKVAGRRCRKAGSIEPGKATVVKMKLRVRSGASFGRKKVRFVASAGNAASRRASAAIIVR